MPISKTEARSAPDYLQFYPTLRCNHDCTFCFNRGLGDLPDTGPADFAELASRCRSLGIGHIDMLGGEPTLHPELFTILDTICGQGLVSTLSTNGRRVESLSEISERYDPAEIRIGVSMNFSDPTEIPPMLDGYIRNRRPIVKAVSDNPRRMPGGLARYASLSGIESYLLYRDVVERGDLSGSIPFDAFYEALQILKGSYTGLEGVFCQGFLPRHGETELKAVRCPAGTTKLSVLPDGSVYPCYLFFRHPDLALGNILKDDFQDIWQHPVLDFFRNFRGNSCPKTGCKLHALCHGGCPALAYIFFGSLDAPDPRCISAR